MQLIERHGTNGKRLYNPDMRRKRRLFMPKQFMCELSRAENQLTRRRPAARDRRPALDQDGDRRPATGKRPSIRMATSPRSERHGQPARPTSDRQSGPRSGRRQALDQNGTANQRQASGPRSDGDKPSIRTATGRRPSIKTALDQTAIYPSIKTALDQTAIYPSIKTALDQTAIYPSIKTATGKRRQANGDRQTRISNAQV
jgi:hypothetical protein